MENDSEQTAVSTAGWYRIVKPDAISHGSVYCRGTLRKQKVFIIQELAIIVLFSPA